MAERRRKLGLPPEDPDAAKPSAPVVEEKKSALPVRPATKAEQMRECLRSLKQNHKNGKGGSDHSQNVPNEEIGVGHEASSGKGYGLSAVGNGPSVESYRC